jgi:hypothetical protein
MRGDRSFGNDFFLGGGGRTGVRRAAAGALRVGAEERFTLATAGGGGVGDSTFCVPVGVRSDSFGFGGGGGGSLITVSVDPVGSSQVMRLPCSSKEKYCERRGGCGGVSGAGW